MKSSLFLAGILFILFTFLSAESPKTKIRKILSALTAFGLLLFSCVSEPIRPAVVTMEGPADSCIVAGYIDAFGGNRLYDLMLVSGALANGTQGGKDYFAFVSVPRGRFELSYMTVFDAESPGLNFEFKGANVRVNREGWYPLQGKSSLSIVNGSCNGGFIWAGEFALIRGKGNAGNRPVYFIRKPAPEKKAEIIKTLKEYYRGSEWETVIE